MFPSLSRFTPNWTHPLPTHDGALKIDPKGCVTTRCVTIRREHLFTRRAIRQKAHHHPPAAAKSEEYESHPDSQWRDADGMGNLVYYNINHQYKCHSIFICVLSAHRAQKIGIGKNISVSFQSLGGGINPAGQNERSVDDFVSLWTCSE